MSKRRGRGCRGCPGCLRENCGTCRNCRDMREYGGTARRKKRCTLRKCTKFQGEQQGEIERERERESPISYQDSNTKVGDKEEEWKEKFLTKVSESAADSGQQPSSSRCVCDSDEGNGR
ncbi:hypothetical protein GBAR_LOCUS14855 [Geodia barretti]|uniref:CXXC-type domain-containing protein n=1 Tax=Geodia barretti TaxID=519541 RepID=A0AA35WQU2_GEOBA|nr:hypothetical protein GBAR_LOCUS14855 [Geodia barretti]